MPYRPDFYHSEQWINKVFSVQAVNRGGVIRRATRDIDRLVGREAFVRELERRGFRAVENAGKMVIFCNQEPIRRVR